MKNKKRLIILIVTIVILFLVVFTPLARKFIPPRTVRLKAYFHLYSSPARTLLVQVLDDFTAEYPYIKLEYHIEPYQEMRRLLLEELNNPEEKTGIVSVLAGKDLDLLTGSNAGPAPWISSVWNLYYNSKRLEDLDYSRSDLQELSNNGIEVFAETLQSKLEGGESVFSAGIAFFWPRLAWIQHLELLAADGRNPSGYSPEEWSSGIESWDVLIEHGYFNPDLYIQNFAGSQLAVSDGTALFVLSDSSIYSTYPPDQRNGIDSIPFPGSIPQKWQVGSGYYLSGSFLAEEKRNISEAEDLLVSYLHGDGVRDQFLQKAGIRLLSRNPEAELRDIPSLTQKAGSPELQDLLKFRK